MMKYSCFMGCNYRHNVSSCGSHYYFSTSNYQALQLSEEVEKIITVFMETASKFSVIVLNIVKNKVVWEL